MECYGGRRERVRLGAEQQHTSLVRGLQRALDDKGWRARHVRLGGMCGSVDEEDFAVNMEMLGVAERERDTIRMSHRKRHVWGLLEEQDRVLRSYNAQREGFERGGRDVKGQVRTGREHVGRGVYL